jgi:hypothetical protein
VERLKAAEVVENALPVFCARKYEADDVLNPRPTADHAFALVVEKKFLCVCQKSALVVENAESVLVLSQWSVDVVENACP